MSHLAYLGILAFCLLCVAPLGWWLRQRVFGDPRRLAASIATTFVVFSAWDVYAIHAGHWSYDPRRTTGLLLPFRLPLEEALFFVVVPLCIVLTYEAVSEIRARRTSKSPGAAS